MAACIGLIAMSAGIKRDIQKRYDAAKKEKVILHGQFTGEWSQITLAIKDALSALGYTNIQEHPLDRYNRTKKEIWTNPTSNHVYRGDDITLPSYIRVHLRRENEESDIIRYSITLFRIESPDRLFHNLDSHYSKEYLTGPIRSHLEREFQKFAISTDPSQFKVTVGFSQ